MTRQALFRVLLSFLLLMSQQMATAHVISHMHTSAGGTLAQLSQAESELSAALAQDQTCNQCLAYAQLSGPLGHTPRAFAIPEQTGSALVREASHPACARTICPFEQRGPPQA